MAGRTVTIRRSLLTNLGLMIVGLCLAIFGITVYTSRQIVDLSADRLIDRALDRAGADLAAVFDPIEDQLQVARRWAGSGVLDPGDDATLTRLFLPILDAHPQISSFHLGDADGRAWMLLRDGAQRLTRRVDPPRWGEGLAYREWPAGTSPDHARAWRDEAPEPDDRYDPRTRDWYRTAQHGARTLEPGVEAPSGVYWTDPYVFFTTREPGITAAIHARAADGRPWVLAFDVLLRDLSEYTSRISVSEHGFVGVLDSRRRMIGVPRLAGLEEPDARSAALLQQPRTLGIRVFDEAVAAWQAASGGTGGEAGEVFSFESDGRVHWAGVRTVEMPPVRRFDVVVMIPESDLVGPIRELQAGVLLATLVALAVALLSAFRMAERYSRPLSALARESARIRRLDLRPADPVPTKIREVAELVSAQANMRTTLDAFSRYVPTDVVRELVELGEAARIGGERRVLTVLFTDIQGFTSIAEQKSPEALTQHLAGYFEEMLGLIDDTGTVDKLIGDGIMAFWGAPYPDPYHARHAAEAALACVARLGELNRQWALEGEPLLPTRFGLAAGPALVGNVGSPRRLSYTAVGDVVNLASRLEGLNRLYGTEILAAEAVREAAGDRFVWREVDRVRVVGRGQTVAVFELLGARGAVDRERLTFAKGYARALALHRERAWGDAIAVLDGLSATRQADLSVLRLRDTCAALAESPPPEDWEAVTTLERK